MTTSSRTTFRRRISDRNQKLTPTSGGILLLSSLLKWRDRERSRRYSRGGPLKITYLLLPAWLLLSVPQWALAANPMIKDLFDRDITQRGITLVDGESYMGNPAIAVDVVPPSDAAFPVQATVTANESQLYFDLPSDAGAQGPCKQLTFSGNEPTRFSMAVFPFRIKRKRDAVLQIQFTDTISRQWQLNVPIHVTFTDHAGDGETRPAAVCPVPRRPAAQPHLSPLTQLFPPVKTHSFEDAAARKGLEN